MIRLIGPVNSGDTTGGAGVSTSNADTPSPVVGRLLSLYVKYNGTPPATADVVIATKGTSPAPPALTILTLTDVQADGWFHPRHQVHGNTGARLTLDGTRLHLMARM